MQIKYTSVNSAKGQRLGFWPISCYTIKAMMQSAELHFPIGHFMCVLETAFKPQIPVYEGEQKWAGNRDGKARKYNVGPQSLHFVLILKCHRHSRIHDSLRTQLNWAISVNF